MEKFKVGQRVCGDAQGSMWGVIVAVRHIKENAKTVSEKKLAAKSRFPYIYTIEWDGGRTEEFRTSSVRSLWLAGDVNLKRQALVDPKAPSKK